MILNLWYDHQLTITIYESHFHQLTEIYSCNHVKQTFYTHLCKSLSCDQITSIRVTGLSYHGVSHQVVTKYDIPIGITGKS